MANNATHSLTLESKIIPPSDSQIKKDIQNVESKVKSLNKPVRLDLSFDFDKLQKNVPSKVRKIFEDIQKEATSFGKINIGTRTDASGRDITTYSAKYQDEFNNSLVKTVTLTDILDQKGKKIGVDIQQRTNVTRDAYSIEKKETAELEKQTKQIERQVQYAKEFLERSKGLQQTPEVKQGKEIAGKIVSGGQLPITKENVSTLKDATNQLKVLDAGIKQSGTSMWSWGDQLKVALQRTMEWASATAVIYGAMRQFQEGVQYIKDLDKELTNVQIATGMTKEQTYQLAEGYNEMASELGATTMEVSQSATLFLKQGKTIEETNKLIKSSMMLSKLGMLDNAQASEYLTTILNGYKLEVEDANEVVSRMIAVDNASAASVSGMSEALSKTSSVARDSGVELSNLIAYIATVQTVTGQTGEVVGQAFDKIEALWYNK